MAGSGEIKLQQNGTSGKSKYAWRYIGGKMNCYKSPKGTCVIGKPPSLWEAEELTEFHDVTLAQATREINAVLKRLAAQKPDATNNLSLILFQNRHFLVWTTPGTIGPDDKDEDVARALRLKRK